MIVELYTKPSCPHCVRAKQILQNHNISYNEFEMGRNITREELKNKFPKAKYVPIIIVDDEQLDGVGSLQLLLEQK